MSFQEQTSQQGYDLHTSLLAAKAVVADKLLELVSTRSQVLAMVPPLNNDVDEVYAIYEVDQLQGYDRFEYEYQALKWIYKE